MIKKNIKWLTTLLCLLSCTLLQAKFHYGGYRLPNDDYMNLTQLGESQFSLIHSYHFEHQSCDAQWLKDAKAYLRAAAERKCQVFLGLPRSLLKFSTENETTVLKTISELVRALRDEDGLFAWYLYDEPSAELDERLQKIYRVIKFEDSVHPVVVVHFSPERFDAVSSFCDLPWLDTYPVPWSIHRVYEAALKARELAGKPIWSVIQAHGLEWQNHVQKNQAIITDRQHRPNPKEFRAMVHAALAADAEGIVVYFLPQRMHDMNKHTPLLWKAICDMGKELQMLGSPLQKGARKTGCKVELLEMSSRQRRLDKVYGGGEKGTAEAYYHEKDEILSWQRAYDDKLYLGVVNAGYTPQVKVGLSFEKPVSGIRQLPQGQQIFADNKLRQQNSEITLWKVSKDAKAFELYFNEADAIVWEVEFK